jgi:hypothetical protein
MSKSGDDTPDDIDELPKGDSKALLSLLRIENSTGRHSDAEVSKWKLADIYKHCPKIKTMVENIKRLDQIDLASGNGLFKHYIYSRVPGGWNGGITLTTAVFRALKGEGYEVYVSKDDVKTIVAKFNDREKNVRGDEIRFIGLSSNHKEGLDLFEVKYAHIYEIPSTQTDLEQIIGRGTRQCGQKKLPFPWDLHVFVYRLSIPQSMRNIYRNGKVSLDYDYLADLYNQHKVGYGDVMARLSDYAHYMSVDYGLTQNYTNLKPIGNLELVPIRLQGPAEYTRVTTFKPYSQSLDDLKRQEEEDKKISDFLKNQQLLIDITKSKRHEEPGTVDVLPETEEEIILKALEILRSRKSSSSSFSNSTSTTAITVNPVAMKQIPSKGIMKNILTFLKSMGINNSTNSSLYKIIDEKDCTVKIGKARGKLDPKKDFLMTYPVVKGDKLYNFCFLKAELLDLIQNNNGYFSDEMMIEIETQLQRRVIPNVTIQKRMSDEFKAAVIESNHPLFTKTTVEKSLMTVVLDMMIGYLSYTSVDVNAGLFYKFLNFSRNTFVGLLKVPLQMTRFILTHPTLSVVFIILVKLLKIVVCIYTSGMKKAIISNTIKTITKSMGESPLAQAFRKLLISIAECATDSLTAVMSGGVGIFTALSTCLGKFGLSSFNLSTAAQWIMSTVISTLRYTMEKVTTFNLSSLVVLQEMIKNPFATVTTLVFGVNVSFGPQTEQSTMIQSYIETISFYMKGDLNMLTVAVILQLMPYNFMKWMIGKLIELTATVVSLNKMLVDLSAYVDTMKDGVLSCLDLVIWIMNTYPHYEIVWYVIREMKALFMEIMPCLFAKIKGYFMRLYDANAKDEFVDCCTSDIRSAVELVMGADFARQPSAGLAHPDFSANPGNLSTLLNPDMSPNLNYKPPEKGYFASGLSSLYNNATSIVNPALNTLYNNATSIIDKITFDDDGEIGNLQKFLKSQRRQKRRDGGGIGRKSKDQRKKKKPRSSRVVVVQ